MTITVVLKDEAAQIVEREVSEDAIPMPKARLRRR
jgi:hypothetical protein